MPTSLVVIPETFRRIQLRQLKVLLLPLYGPSASDEFKEFQIEKTCVRIYFNGYQYGFNFLLAQHLCIYADDALARKQFYSRVREVDEKLTLYQEALGRPEDPSRLRFSVKKVNVIRQINLSQWRQHIGCSETEAIKLFPLVVDRPWLLLVELNFKNEIS